MAAAGVRQRDTKGNAVRHTDVWHLGSCTKAMTATLVAVLIDAGSFPGYSTTLAQCTKRSVDGKPCATFDGCYADVTMEQLLTHTAGIPPNSDVWGLAWELNGKAMSMPVQRAKYLSALLSGKSGGKGPTGIYSYSNEGYIIAAHMIELHCGKDYETLLRQELFVPLGMASARFGRQGNPDDLQGKTPSEEEVRKVPWGHGEQSGWVAKVGGGGAAVKVRQGQPGRKQGDSRRRGGDSGRRGGDGGGAGAGRGQNCGPEASDGAGQGDTSEVQGQQRGGGAQVSGSCP